MDRPSYVAFTCVNRIFREVSISCELWQCIPRFVQDPSESTLKINTFAFKFIRKSHSGTEGECSVIKQLSDGKEYALKKSKLISSLPV